MPPTEQSLVGNGGGIQMVAAGPGSERTIVKLSADAITQAKNILEPLAAKKKEWAREVTANAKIGILKELVTTLTAWGKPMQLGAAQMEARNIDPNVGKGAGLASQYGLAMALISVKYCKALQKGIAGVPIPKVDLPTQYGVTLNRSNSTAAAATGSSPADDDITVYAAPSTIMGNVLVFCDAAEEVTHNNSSSNGSSTSGGIVTSRMKYTHDGEVAIVLGAGNQAILGVLDTLYHIFVEGRVCVLKAHDMQLRTISPLTIMLEPLIRKGYLHILEADLQLTQALIYSDLTDCVHITGGINTHDAILWGASPAEQVKNKKNHTPILKAEMVSELGAVTPFFILPGSNEAPLSPEWTPAMVKLHATNLMKSLVDNNSCNCLAAKVLILPADYPDLCNALLTEFKTQLAAFELEPVWYPGTENRYKRWNDVMKGNGAEMTVFSDAKIKNVGHLPGHTRGVLPFVIADLGKFDSLEQLESQIKDMSWTQEEPFAPVLAVLRLAGSTLDSYITTAFKFADEKLWGNLSCAIACPPSAQTAMLQQIVDGKLRYGTYAVNGITLEGFQYSGRWGGIITNTLENAQSGVGSVLNGFMLEKPRYTVFLKDFKGPAVDDFNMPHWLVNLLALLFRYIF